MREESSTLMFQPSSMASGFAETSLFIMVTKACLSLVLYKSMGGGLILMWNCGTTLCNSGGYVFFAEGVAAFSTDDLSEKA